MVSVTKSLQSRIKMTCFSPNKEREQAELIKCDGLSFIIDVATSWTHVLKLQVPRNVFILSVALS